MYFLTTHVFIDGGDCYEKNRIWIKANKKVFQMEMEKEVKKMSTWTSNEVNKNLAKSINNNEEYHINDYLRHDDLNVIVQALLDLVEEEEVTNQCLRMVTNEALKNRIISKQGLNVKMTNSGEQLNYVEIVYDYRELPLYLEVIPSQNTTVNGVQYLTYDVKKDDTTKTLTLKISETQALRSAEETGNKNFTYILNFYADEAKTNLFSTLEGTVTYTYESDVASGD